MFSYQCRVVLHFGQCDAGKTIDWSGSGSRRITTLRKLPMMAPKSADRIRIKFSVIMIRCVV